ncbi:alpha/beta hydrolase [Lacticaseibacillus mingshuiensis]|uniref:Alpha/beta hydrolase n=1 Tax=Lacticaseibacillus mingshuiensis TaxID=2799574 RepID=A0ABW4CFG2_9LACO|nr:alpha/beta hydrolase [Lacticaseibacillus mingshuiensis]
MAWLILIGCLAFGAALDFYMLGRPQKKREAAIGDHTPTLFVPGYLGNRLSFGHMLRRLPIDKQVVAVVTRSGRVRLRGHLQLGPHVGVQVLFADKRIRPRAQREGLMRVVAALQKQAAFSEINLVAHSMGGVTALLYTISRPPVPVAALVSIAAPYNDLEVAKNTPILDWHLTGTGPEQTAPVYDFFQAHRADLPAQLRWLNIAGDLFTGSLAHDGVVGVNSSFAVRFLAENTVADYREAVVRGPRAAHSLLHENPVVAHDITTFLWGPRQLAAKTR